MSAAGSGTENDSQRLAFSIFALVLGEPAEIQLHLPFVLSLEASLLQLYGDQALELSVIEKQVDVEVISIKLNALLTSNEGKAGA